MIKKDIWCGLWSWWSLNGIMCCQKLDREGCGKYVLDGLKGSLTDPLGGAAVVGNKVPAMRMFSDVEDIQAVWCLKVHLLSVG